MILGEILIYLFVEIIFEGIVLGFFVLLKKAYKYLVNKLFNKYSW